MKKFNQHGAIPVGFAILFLATMVLGVAAGYKAVQQPTRTTPLAQSYTCTTIPSPQYPNRKCEDTSLGACTTYGSWQYKCSGTQGPCASDAGVGVPFWCDGQLWHNMNYFGECITTCKSSTVQPTAAPGGGGSTGSGGCFYLTAQISSIGDVWVTFNRTGSPPIIGDIQLLRNDVGVAGYNPWNQASGPFTYHPGTYNAYQKVPLGSTVKFTGRMDECKERGNRDDITCTLSNDGNTVSGTRCSKYGSSQNPPTATQPPNIPPTATSTPNRPIPTATIDPNICIAHPEVCAAPSPTVKPTDIPNCWIPPFFCNTPPTTIPTRVPTATPRPTNTPTPTPTIPFNADCGYPPQRCCSSSLITCYRGSCNEEIFKCEYPKPTPTNTPTPGHKPPFPQPPPQNAFQRVIQNIPFIPKPEPVAEEAPTAISGKVKINSSVNKAIEVVYVSLYDENNKPLGPNANALSGTYSFDGLEVKDYKVKAWIRTTDGAWYQNNPCLPTGGDYDCKVQPGQTRDLNVDIGPQGARGLFIKAQDTSQSFIQNFRQTVENIPVIGPFIQMFIISAF